jgi:hypothetical protein
MKITKSRSSKPRSLRLHRKEWTETDGDREVRVEVLERGLLRRETRKKVARSISELKDPNFRDILRGLCDKLRDELEELGVPSDRQPFWTKGSQGQYVPLAFPPGESRVAASRDFANWKAALNSLTEPLSVEQETGELLYHVRQLLARDGIDPHLPRIWLTMRAYANYRLAGEGNVLFDDAVASREGRSHGPKTVANRAAARREIVAAFAEEHWLEHPRMRGDASNTAARISDAVNQCLASKELLPGKKRKLSPKTIGDHIRIHLDK